MKPNRDIVIKPNTCRLISLILIIVSVILIPITYILELQDLYWLAWTILGLSPFVIFILWSFTLPSYESGLILDPQNKAVTLKKRTHGNQNQLKIKRYIKTYTKYNPSKTVFTSATVGGITTGGFHQTQAYYSEQASGLGGYYLETTNGNDSFIVEKILLNAQLTKQAKEDKRVSHLVKNNSLMLLRDGKDTKLTSSENEILRSAIMSGNYAMQQNITERAFSARFITKQECVNVLAWICENAEEDLLEQKTAEEEKNEWRKKTKIPFIVTAISLVAVSIVATFWILLSPSTKYNSAEKHFRNGNYLKAAEIYESLDGYSDSNNQMFKALLLGGYYRDKTEIVIPDGVTYIPEETFCGYTDLKSVTLPNGIRSIGKKAFKYCSNLNTINIPEGITEIQEGTFNGCYNLASVTIPDSVTTIGDYAFSNCSSLASVSIGNAVTSIGYYAFEGCNSLISITIPDSVTSIGGSTFSNCSNLASVTIPDSVTSIGGSTFSNCSNLASVTIPDSVTSIGDSTFSNCSSLASITIPDSVTFIGDSAFKNCTKLTSVIIPNSVTSIGQDAFRNCTNLTSVIIPDSVTSIGANAFEGCENLIIYTELESRPSDWDLKWNGKDIPADVIWQYTGEHGVTNDGIVWCYLRSGVAILGYNGNNANLVIPETINNIKVTAIHANAFYRNTSVTNITIPEGIISIGNNAFSGCSNLTNISIPNSITDFGNDVFSDCELLIFKSFNGATYLGNTDNPYLILCKGNADCSINENTKIIAYKAFYGILSLKSITIPDSVTIIGDYAFAECSYLSFVSIGNSVTIIGEYAFDDCYNLISVTLGDSVTTIGSHAFYGCRELSSIIIPNSVTSIGRYAFSCCFDLKNVTFKNPTGWKYIYYDNKSYTIDNLSDTSVAAEYLTNKYDYHDWKRS